MEYFVYLHKRKTDGAVFYVGQGKNGRAFNFNGRNQIWERIASKHGVDVDIVLTELTREQALAEEIRLVAIYGRLNNKTGVLANMTDGGDGGLGLTVTDETKIKISEKSKAAWNKPGAKDMASKKRKGEGNAMFGKKHSEEVVQQSKIRSAEWSNKNRDYLSQKTTKQFSDPAARLAASEKAKEHWSNPDERSKQSAKRLAWAAQASAEQRLAGAFSPYAKAVICDELGLFFLCAKDAEKAGYGHVAQSARTGCKAKGHHWRYATPEEIAKKAA